MLHSQFGGDKIKLSVVQTCCNWTKEKDFTADMGNVLPVLQVEVGGPVGCVPYLQICSRYTLQIPAGISYPGPLTLLTVTHLLPSGSANLLRSFNLQHRRIGVQATETKREMRHV